MQQKPLSTQAFVKTIKVRRLFGSLDYDLEFDLGCHFRLALLYGDNGCGKTTVLKLLYHLLTPVPGRGHKTVLAKASFTTFEVTLSSGVKVGAHRPLGKTTGAVTFVLKHPRQNAIKVSIEPDESGAVSSRSVTSGATLEKFLRVLSALNVELFFMRDNRRITSSRDDNHADEDVAGTKEFLAAARRGRESEHQERLLQAIGNCNSYFSQLALTARSRGEGDTNKIYGDIVKHLSRLKTDQDPVTAADFSMLPSRLKELEKRNDAFAAFGLTSAFSAGDLLTHASTCPAPARTAILNVLKPYIEGLEARLDALASVQKLIAKFVESLNSFFGGAKSATFNIQEGIKIYGYNNEVLDPILLSSGERQLLTVLCHLLPARTAPAIFIVDEPELSLNVKWQRKLLDSLLGFTENAAIQMIFATHSIELMTPHRSEVIRFIPNSGKKAKYILPYGRR